MKKVYILPCTRISNMMPSSIIAGSGDAEGEVGQGGNHGQGNGIGGYGDEDTEGAGAKGFYHSSSDTNW